MVVPVPQLDLELDAAEERRGRMEDEPVGAGRPAPVSSTCVESEAVAIGSDS